MRVPPLQSLKLGKIAARRRGEGELRVASARSDVDAPVTQTHRAIPRDQRKGVEDVGQMLSGELGDRCAFGADSPGGQITDHAHRRCSGSDVALRRMKWGDGQTKRQKRNGNQRQTHIGSILYDWKLT